MPPGGMQAKTPGQAGIQPSVLHVWRASRVLLLPRVLALARDDVETAAAAARAMVRRERVLGAIVNV